MYAIKIINRYTAFHLADEVTYRHVDYANKAEFWEQIGELQPAYQIGDSPSSDDKPGNYVDLCLYRNPENVKVKEIIVMPESWIYIMQDGKTIEIIKVR